MTDNPLAGAVAGEHWHLETHREDGSPLVFELVIVNLDGEPWVCWDYVPLSPLAEWPESAFAMGNPGEYRQVVR